MTPAQVLAEMREAGELVCTADAVGVVLGMSGWSVLRSVREGTCPIEPIRVGRRRVVFRVSDLVQLVGAA